MARRPIHHFLRGELRCSEAALDNRGLERLLALLELGAESLELVSTESLRVTKQRAFLLRDVMLDVPGELSDP